MPNAMQSRAVGLGERGRGYGKQLTGGQSSIPADPLAPTAGDGGCTALPPLTQAWFVPPWYLLVSAQEPYVVNACKLGGKQTGQAQRSCTMLS